jgi:hypothetical protein
MLEQEDLLRDLFNISEGFKTLVLYASFERLFQPRKRKS